MAGQGQGAGTAASGGKGGSYGGNKMPTNYPMSAGGNMPNYGVGGGKGGKLPQAYPSIENYSPPGALPNEPNAMPQTPAAPNGFEQGLSAMNQGMDWFQNAMNNETTKIGGNYGVSGLDSGKYMDQLGTAGGGGYRAAMMSAPDKALYDYNPAMAQGQSYQAQQLSDKNINDYMNPYTQNVIDTTMADLDKARQQAMNSTGAQATAGGAFGGDRHAIMESQNNADYMDQVARSSAQLRNQGYQNAQNAAMGDVSSVNQQRGMNAQMAQQANMANQSAANDRSRFVGSTANSNAMQTAAANQSATNAAASLGAQLSSQASIANARDKNAMLGQLMGYENANNQFNAGMDFNKDKFNAAQDQLQYQNQANAANQYYNMGNDRWDMTNDMNTQMGQVGGRIDGINQGMLDQALQMWNQQQGAPFERYQSMLGALSGVSGGGGQTQSYSPGKMDYLGAGTGIASLFMGSDIRLKENIEKVATVNGINLYSWDWNEEGETHFPGQKPFGVIAQEIAETRPDAVVEHDSGYLMVNYGRLPEVSRAVMVA